jgi:hypothetical protein
MSLPQHNRYDYSVISERKDYCLPDGKRLAFCVTTNIEVYAYRKGTGWDPAKKGEPQQQRNEMDRRLLVPPLAIPFSFDIDIAEARREHVKVVVT